MNIYDDAFKIQITRGSAFSADIVVTGSGGAPRDIQGYSGFCYVLDRWGSRKLLGVPAASFTGPASGCMNLAMDAAQTTLMPATRGVYAVALISGAQIETVRFGVAEIYPGLVPPVTGQFAILDLSNLSIYQDWDRDVNGDWQPIY